MPDMTHLDSRGNAIMVDTTDKSATQRRAVATGRITMSAACYTAVRQGAVAKGDAFAAARIAGIMAVKKTSSLIPLCHNILIEQASVDFDFDDKTCSISAVCTVKTTGTTGVEMEALTGVGVALLTIYDMCKSMDRGLVIGDIYLQEKTGGKSGTYRSDRS